MKQPLAEAYEKRMLEIGDCSWGDPEAAHGKADDLLCELLTELGYGKLVDIYNRVEKWYA
jgi:hypothetical protein